MSTSYPKVYLKGGVVCPNRPASKGRPIMPAISHKDPPKEKKEFSKEDMLELAREMAKEMAQEMSKNIPQQIVVQSQVVPAHQSDDVIELESGFVDPTESENFSVNLDNIESTSGDNIKDKLAKLKKIKGDG